MGSRIWWAIVRRASRRQTAARRALPPVAASVGAQGHLTAQQRAGRMPQFAACGQPYSPIFRRQRTDSRTSMTMATRPGPRRFRVWASGTAWRQFGSPPRGKRKSLQLRAKHLSDAPGYSPASQQASGDASSVPNENRRASAKNAELWNKRCANTNRDCPAGREDAGRHPGSSGSCEQVVEDHGECAVSATAGAVNFNRRSTPDIPRTCTIARQPNRRATLFPQTSGIRMPPFVLATRSTCATWLAPDAPDHFA